MEKSLTNVAVVANTGEDKITFIDLKEFKVIREIFLNNVSEKNHCGNNYYGPHHLLYDTNNKYIYTANSHHASISVIDLITNKVTENVYVGSFPCHIAINTKYNNIYISNYDSNTISCLDKKKLNLKFQIPVGNMPHDIILSKDKNYLYVANSASNNISIINTFYNDVVDKIKLNYNPIHFDISKDNKFLFVACRKYNCKSKGYVCIVDLQDYSVLTEYNIGALPSDIALLKEENKLCVTDSENNILNILDLSNGKILDNIKTCNMPSCISIDKDNNYILVGCLIDNSISIFDANKLTKIKELYCGKDPSSIILINS